MAHKDVDFDVDPVIGFVLQTGDVKKFPHALGLESLDPFLRFSNSDAKSTTRTYKQNEQLTGAEL